MNREQAYLRMLSSTANMQWNIAVMLEAKASEAEKMRSWFCNHLHSHSFSSQQTQLGQSLQMHDQVIEVIDGITKLNQGMVSIIKAVLPQNEDDEESFGNSGDSFGKGFTFGDKK
ncbi:restriction endonuclease subunit S [Paenibacillus alkaliterrae]|uniref:restriction endonuclease subunit S n=1 Tax=Paenibacillus alkaliterrae TaxID=320909 RepID=UPI001F1725DB|nr:restriction endonuclease subunit S [Paenibacillus alkaliterrae]MCF2938570.1 restriction endonuclease subunit S [Paenibacillus alkaliterrae]